MIIAVVGLTANCSDDNEKPEKSLEVDEEEDERHFVDSISAQGVICQMYDIQEDGTYTLKRGRNINPSEPNTYYYVCSDIKEAALFYNNYCTNEPQKVGYDNVGDSLVAIFDVTDRKSTFGNYGYTSLSIGNGNPDYATIELSFNTIGDVHKLIFVPASYMQDNSDYKPFQKPYTLGDIYKDKDNNQWLCVKESQPNSDGYFVRLTDGDGVYWDRKNISDHYKTVWYAEKKDKYTIAGKDAWESFVKILTWTQGQDALRALKDRTNETSMDATRDLMKTINNEDESWRIFQVGDVKTSGKDYHWKCARYLYKIWVPYIVVHGKHGYYIGEAYAWHELKNDNLKSESLKSGKELLQLSFRESKLSNMTKVFPVQSGRQ